MKKTLILSIVMHISLFSAALLFSAGLIKGSRNIPYDDAWTVRLEEDEGPTAPIVSEKKPLSTSLSKSKKTDTVQSKAEVSKQSPLPDNKTAPEQQPRSDVSAVKKSEMSGTIKKHDGPAVSVAAGNPETGEVIIASAPAPESSKGGLQHSGKTEGTIDPGIMEMIGRAIERAKTYPLIARKRGMEGTVYVRFSINPEGQPREIEILKSSGFRILDRATVNIVQHAGPYPHIARRIEVPVAYRLKD